MLGSIFVQTFEPNLAMNPEEVAAQLRNSGLEKPLKDFVETTNIEP